MKVPRKEQVGALGEEEGQWLDCSEQGRGRWQGNGKEE